MNKRGKIITSFSALAAYSAVVLLLVLYHEYWFDEAQAWNIARDNDIAGIIGMMRYEGHPPLWHFILKIFIGLGCSWQALGLVSWGFSTAAAAVVVFALPVKPYLKAAVLLSSSMLYINSVISRVYCVINLLLVLIAWVYPNRKKHPLLFGLLVALLANTHICMCGLVGIIGIFMLIDYFGDFKTNTVRQNVLNTCGLLTAGAGVVLLVLPLLNSLGSNSAAAENVYTVGGVLTSLVTSVSDIVDSGSRSNLPLLPGLIFSVTIQAAMFLMFVFLRKKRRTFVTALVFTVFYIVIVEVVWYSQPNRGALFIFSLAMICVMGRAEQPVSGKKQETSGSRLVGKFIELDKRTESSVSVLCAVMLIMSAPSGIKYAADDLRGEFAPYKAAAEFIEENVPADALLVSSSDAYAALMIYLPERQIYSTRYGRFYTYCSHETAPGTKDIDGFIQLAERYDSIYYIDYPFELGQGIETVYSNTDFIPFVLPLDEVAVYRVSLDNISVLF